MLGRANQPRRQSGLIVLTMSFRFATSINNASARLLFSSTMPFSVASNSLGDYGPDKSASKVTDSRTLSCRLAHSPLGGA